MGRHDDWDEELSKDTKQRRNNRRRRKISADQEYMNNESSEFIKSLDSSKGTGWMAEKKYKRMFTEIEEGLSGVLGDGPFEWVDRRVFDAVFDRLTLMSLYKLMKSGLIDTLDFPIARGKEAHVFHGTGETGPVAVKIFHTSNAVFKNLVQYIEGDPRFGGLKRRHRDLVDIWVRKEFRNLSRLEKWGLAVPKPLGVHKNVLVMEYLGNSTAPSPRLRDVKVIDPAAVYEELLEFLAVTWQKANMVHGDFSPYNIMWHGDRPVVIDVGQAVVQSHPKSQEFLVRDVTRLVEWANKNGLEIELAEAMYDVLEMDLSHIDLIDEEE
ncbi:MAG: serine protein kinase RIO [Euryarchaeota archaeon]|nr:serine protein kinase RIO [Euryarchaeota archaeon]|tara:strand:+ start:1768 stop:2739 length:972 start_codon:yes stop_codon:yes gene_type:complete